MSTLRINLNELNSERAEDLARQFRKSPDELVNEVFARFAAGEGKDDRQKFLEWREAMLEVKGIWADRDDLPDFDDIRKSLDRDPWNR